MRSARARSAARGARAPTPAPAHGCGRATRGGDGQSCASYFGAFWFRRAGPATPRRALRRARGCRGGRITPMSEELAPYHAAPFAIARIDEAACIGCTLCVAACPVDAIVGAAKLMHTVLAERCTGCELCLPPCPVDCIALVARPRPWTAAHAEQARAHEAVRTARLAAAAARDAEHGR